MKNGFIIGLFSFLCLAVYAQPGLKIPKKLCGIYTGSQPAYVIKSNGYSSQVMPAEMRVEITRTSISVCYESPQRCTVKEGALNMIKREGKGASKRWIIQVLVPNSLFTEDFEFNSKNKELTRQGVYPQPNTKLRKSRKK